MATHTLTHTHKRTLKYYTVAFNKDKMTIRSEAKIKSECLPDLLKLLKNKVFKLYNI